MNFYNWNSDFPRTPERFHNKLCSTLAQLPDKEKKIMNKKTVVRRGLVFAAIAVMVLATTVFAAGKLFSSVSHTYKDDGFTQLPTAAQMESIIKATPKPIKKFDNGFAFTEGFVAHSEDQDENGTVVSRYKTLNLSYINDSQRVFLVMEKHNTSNTFPKNSTQIAYNDITMYAHGYIDKIVPLDYTPTEQDKLDEAAGRLNLGTMGGDTIEIQEVQTLMWIDGEVSYLLISQGGTPLSGDELAAMAKQIIDLP